MKWARQRARMIKKKMKIESCTFGKVIIDGAAYTRDVIVFPDRIQKDWWRQEGHSLSVADLKTVFERKPACFIMGCGHSRVLKVPDATRQALAEAGIELIELDTKAACDELNQRFANNEDAACGLHLTC